MRVMKLNNLHRMSIYPLAMLVVLYVLALFTPNVFAATNGKITYCSDSESGNDVFVMDADGSNKTQLTTDGTSCYPSIAPNGSKVMYWNLGSEPPQTGMINPDGTSNQPNLVAGAYGGWLPNSARIFFIDFSSGFEVKTANVDGSSQQPLDWTPGFEGGLNVISFSPDGSKIAYANPDGEGASVYVADADGSNPVKVNSVIWALMPNFSADGETIYFVGITDSETYSLYSVGVDGSDETELQTMPTTGYSAKLQISPDGTKLLYGTINEDDSTKDVYTMNLDGSNQIKIIDDYDLEGDAIFVYWSPDSNKLVFPDVGTGEGLDIYTINADGTDLTNLTNTPDEQEIIGYASHAWGAAPESSEPESDSADQDNIPDATENAAPNDGDANNDGSLDSEQSKVASFVDPVSEKYAVLEVSDECSITSVSTNAESANTTQDSGFSYPTGLMDFTLDCGTPGFTADISQYYYGQDSSDFIVRKYNPDTKQYTTIDQAELSNETIDSQSAVKATYQVTDGSSLDLDGAEDGNIHDPAGLATSTEALADTGQNTQTLVLLATILLSSGLAVSTYIFNKQRKHNHATTKN